LLIADYDLWDALVTVLGLFFLVLWLWVLITIIADVFRDHELSGGMKAVWLFGLIFLPFITAFIYLITRGQGMRERAIRQQAETRQHAEAYIREVAGSSPVDEIAKLNDLRQQGAISQEEFDRLKAKLVG
jgi:ABC-type multidrug transport system fused ATPase/permease subunit